MNFLQIVKWNIKFEILQQPDKKSAKIVLNQQKIGKN